MTQAIERQNVYTARWDTSFGPHMPTTCKKIAQIAWNVFSVIIPIIALARYGAYKINQQIIRRALLISVNKQPETIAKERENFHNFWTEGNGRDLPFSIEAHTIVTPDKIPLSAYFLRHREADGNTPTILYFNPNGATLYETPFGSLFKEGVARNTICNYVLFDYRGTGDSKGKCTSFDDLVVDGASVLQWVREKTNTPADRIHFYGWSLGGAVAAHVKALESEKTPGKFISERSLSSIEDMIHAHLTPYVPLSLCKGWIKWDPRVFLKKLASYFGYTFNAATAFEKLKGRKLVIYHPNDFVIPYQASLKRRVMNTVHQTVRLETDMQNVNHHIFPLEGYRDGVTGVRALAQIGDFVFSPQA